MAEPTSLKSLVLSLLQSLSQLDEAMSGSSKRWWKTADANRTRLLEAEAYACAQVLRMFHRSVLLLDEAIVFASSYYAANCEPLIVFRCARLFTVAM